MSRAGYVDDCDGDNWDMIRWRGAVTSAIRGKRGQDFLREMLTALDSLPDQCLARGELQTEHGDVCALGSVGRARGLDMSGVDVEDYAAVSKLFGISEALAREIMWVNDEHCSVRAPSKKRFATVRAWILDEIRSRGQLVLADTRG
jgi:hypothetical protein